MLTLAPGPAHLRNAVVNCVQKRSRSTALERCSLSGSCRQAPEVPPMRAPVSQLTTHRKDTLQMSGSRIRAPTR